MVYNTIQLSCGSLGHFLALGVLIVPSKFVLSMYFSPDTHWALYTSSASILRYLVRTTVSSCNVPGKLVIQPRLSCASQAQELAGVELIFKVGLGVADLRVTPGEVDSPAI